MSTSPREYVNTILSNAKITGSNNICVGWQAGLNLTTGIHNICVGRRAGENITTESNCICIGNGTLITPGCDNQIVIEDKITLAADVNSLSNSTENIFSPGLVRRGSQMHKRWKEYLKQKLGWKLL